MHWLFLLLALAVFLVALPITSIWLMLFCMLVSLAFFLAWARGLYLSKQVERDNRSIIDPVELHRLKQVAEARKAEKAAGSPSDTSSRFPDHPSQ